MKHLMKYIPVTIFLAMLSFSSSLFAQGSYITSISTPASCRAGLSCTINWTFNPNGLNDPDQQLIGFIIEYGTGTLSNFQVHGVISNSTLFGPGTGFYNWTPPINLDGNYVIRIRDKVRFPNGGEAYLTGAIEPITILEAYHITVTAPNSQTITNNEPLTIAYTTNTSNIQVYLRNSSYQDTQIIPDGGGSWNGNNTWTVPTNQAEGDYWIVVKGTNAPNGISAPFRIEPKRLEITYPYHGLLFERGEANAIIQWTANYIPENGVTIMWEHGVDNDTIAVSAGPNQHFLIPEPRYIWGIPGDFELRNGYTITIQDRVLPSINDTQDGTFSVVEPYEESFTLNSARSTSVNVPIDDYSDIEDLSVSEKSQSVSYVDGMGKIRQTISLNSSPDQQDMIGFAEYNDLGQKTIDYLPYAGNSVDGLYVTTAKEEQEEFYCVDSSSGCAITRNTHPYSKTVVEASPLQTVEEQGAPGQQYQPGVGNTIRYETHANVEGDALIHWTLNGSNLVGNGFYPPSTLAISKTIDEDENTSYVYTDREGREILKVGYQNPSTPVKTYYVYDDYGNLRFIIPPEAVDAIEDLPNYQTTILTTSSQIRTTWLTEMSYDGYHRVVEKKIPEAEPVYTVYDKFGRVALTQDGNMRVNNEWFFTKYDIQGRAVLTGVYTEQDPSRHTRAGMQEHLINSPGAPWEDRTATNFGMQHGYTNNSFPNPPNMEGMMLWSVTYYDDYDFNNDGTPDESYVDNPAFTGSADGSITNPEADLVRTHGMVTGSKTRILSTPTVVEHSTDVEYHSHDYEDKEVYYIGNEGATITLRPGFRTKPGQMVVIGNEHSIPTDVFDSYSQGLWLQGVSFYDKYGRTIYSTSTNHVGGQDQSWTQYYFDGKVDRTKSVHSSSSATTTIHQRMEYDHAGRVLAEYHTVDGQPEKKITEHTYNELGQLVSKKLGYTTGQGGSGFLQTLDYSYHLRGWLTSVNNPSAMGSDLFAYRLYYDSIPQVAQSMQKYNGNIVAMDWRTKTPGMAERHRYDYSYDGLNQLTTAKKMRWIPECAGSAPCYEWTNSYEGWSGSYSYDLNGNIQTLNRAGTLYYNDDQLSYTYQGNQIQSITDNASSTYKANGFVDGATAAQEYYYDANGNMHKDLNKGIEHIRYNRMNLPEMIVFSSGHEIHYLYDAAGTKLSKTTYPAGGGETTTDYSGGFVYKNSGIEERTTQIFYDGFESGSGWDGLTGYGDVPISFSTSPTRTGSKSGMLERSTLGSKYSHSNIWVDIYHSEAVEYILSGWFYSNGPDVRFLLFMNEDEESTYYTDVESTEVSDVKNQWVYLEKRVLVSPNIDKLNARVDLYWGAAGTVWYDDISIRRVEPTNEQVVAYFPFSEGTIRNVNGNWQYEYDLKDHLGNVRATFTENDAEADLLQADSYYPFGMKMPGLSYIAHGADENKFTYNGKELEDEFGLDWYHYGARFYDPAVGRWWVVDMVNEFFSPYMYVGNSPLTYTDPDGNSSNCEIQPCPDLKPLKVSLYTAEQDVTFVAPVSDLENHLGLGFISLQGNYQSQEFGLQFLFAERAGIAGSTNIDVNARVYLGSDDRYYADVSASAFTPVSAYGNINYTGFVDVYNEGTYLQSYRLAKHSGPTISGGFFQEVGNITIPIPENRTALKVRVTYLYEEGGFYVAPIPSFVNTSISIPYAIKIPDEPKEYNELPIQEYQIVTDDN